MRGALQRPALAGGITLLVTISILTVGYVVAPNREATYRNDVIGYSLTIPPGWQQIHMVAGSEVPDLDPVFAQAAFFANGPASVLDDQPITSHDTLTSLPEGGALVVVFPMRANPYQTAVSDDWNYPPAPSLGTAESDTPNRSSFRAQGVQYQIDTTYGPNTSADDEQEANALAMSISVDPAPAPPPVGTAIERYPAQPKTTAWRIGTPDRFPPGSVVELSVGSAVAGFPRLFIVTPHRPVEEYVRWMVADWGARCHGLSWSGDQFRCGTHTWTRTGEPIRPAYPPLILSNVTQTWDGQLITSNNGVVEFA